MENVYYVHKRITLNVLFGKIANKPSIDIELMWGT